MYTNTDGGRIQLRLLLNLVLDVTTALRMLNREHGKENVTTFYLPIMIQEQAENNAKIIQK